AYNASGVITNGGSVKISGKGNYTGEAVGYFVIEPFVITNSTTPGVAPITTIELASGTLTYNGVKQTQKIQSVTVTGFGDLKETDDYEVSGNTGTDAGDYTLTVTGTGNFTGSVEKVWNIAKASINEAVVTLSENPTYSGAQIKPTSEKLTVTINDKTLGNSDYEIKSYGENKNVAYNASGVITNGGSVKISGIGNYTGEAEGYFVIEPFDITNSNTPGVASITTITLASGTLTYDGKEQTQEIQSVTVTGFGDLKETDDYEVSGNTGTDAGDYTLTVTGTGNFTGSVEKVWNIAKASINEAVVTLSENPTYSGAQIKPTSEKLTVTINDKTLGNSDYEIKSYGENKNVAYNASGVITNGGSVKISGIGNYTGEAEGYFVIEPKTISELDIEIAAIPDTTYTGSAIEPTLTVTDRTRKEVLQLGTDYTVTYADNVNVGSAPAKATIHGVGNYKDFKTAYWNITPATIAQDDLNIYINQEMPKEVTLNHSVNRVEIIAPDVFPVDYVPTFGVNENKVLTVEENGFIGKLTFQLSTNDNNFTPATFDYTIHDVIVNYNDGAQKAYLSRFNESGWVRNVTLSSTKNGDEITTSKDLVEGVNENVPVFANGNLQVGNITVKIDKTAPDVTIDTVNTNGDGKKYVVTISADDKQLSGVKSISYSINGETEATYTAPITISEAGKYEILAWATDNAGNKTENPKTCTVIIKATPILSDVAVSGQYGDKYEEYKPTGKATFKGKDVPGKFEIEFGDGDDKGETITSAKPKVTVKFTPDEPDLYYPVKTVTGKFTIEKRKVTISAHNMEMVRGRWHEIEYQISNLLDGDKLEPVASSISQQMETNGVKARALQSGDYEITLALNSEHYTAAPATIKAKAKPFNVEFKYEDGDAYCYGQTANIELSFQNCELPKSYKLGNGQYVDFDAQNGSDSLRTVTFVVDKEKFPNDGINQIDITFRKEENVETDPMPLDIRINPSSDKIKLLYSDIIFIDNGDGNFVDYQWYRNDTLLEGATQQYCQQLPRITGVYSAEVITIDGSKQKICPAAEQKPLAKSEPRSVSVYPNPARPGEQFTLMLHNFSQMDIQNCVVYIYNNLGSLAYKGSSQSQEYRISLPAGTYSGYALANGIKVSFKIIVQ
ncbi:MAG: hypothetical protein MJZ66_04010, partial [Bacteroidales bacterium]|nr:hypothetical protein [Bacteroidales bacterium]